MDAQSFLNDLRIATPCPADWSRMKGDDRVRYCQSCDKHVYNLSSMNSDEALALLQTAEGRSCVRLYRRRDGTVITSDCPQGVTAALHRRLKRLVTLATAVLGLGAVNSLLKARECWPYAPLPGFDQLAGVFHGFGSSCRSSLWGTTEVIGETVGAIAPLPVPPPIAPSTTWGDPSLAPDPQQDCAPAP